MSTNLLKIDKASLFAKVDKCSTIDELLKIANLETLKQTYKTAMTSKISHAKYTANQKMLADIGRAALASKAA